MNRSAAALTAAIIGLASCSSDSPRDAAPAAAPSTSTSLTASTTTTAEPAHTSSTTTTAAPISFDINGSPLIEFSIQVDKTLDDRLSIDELTSFVIETLSHRRSWVGSGVGFRLVDDGGLFTIIVASPDLTDQLCAPLQTNGRFSCARNGWIALNGDRWFEATRDWPADLDTYRRYLINHEVGHYILGPTHSGCPGEGQPAPIMMQQTKDLAGCEPNGWVHP